jgi:hypothetical protein
MEPRRESVPYLSWGIPTGAIGGATVAILFFIVDLLAGRPLATPNALGATLFLGEPFNFSRSLDPALVAGYTALHFGIFIGLACVATSLCFGRPKRPSARASARIGMASVLTLAFFVTTSVLSFAFHALSGVWLWTELGEVRILSANFLAAVAMAVLLTYAVHTRWTPAALDIEREVIRRRLDEKPPND